MKNNVVSESHIHDVQMKQCINQLRGCTNKHGPSHNISMGSETIFFYKSWVKMFLYGSKDYKTKY